MKRRLVDLLACPACHADLTLSASVVHDQEVMEATLTCTGCALVYPVAGGIPRFTRVQQTGHAATANAFGFQWNQYSTLDPRYRAQFLDWLNPVTSEYFRDRRVLEGGCGKGRHTVLAAEFGAKDVVAIDLSDAVDAAYANAGGHPAVHIVQADLEHPPVKQLFDYAFSIGVLHHMPHPERGFTALLSRVRPGGHISAWVYGRENNGWIVNIVTPVRERATTRMPRLLLRALSNLLAVPLFAAARMVYRPTAGTGIDRLLPYGDYIRYIAPLPYSEHRTIVFDHLVAPIAHYLTRNEFTGWFERAALTDVRIAHHNANSWRGFAQLPLEA